ncbi:unnamed protein product [Phaeothamnion confervicola]
MSPAKWRDRLGGPLPGRKCLPGLPRQIDRLYDASTTVTLQGSKKRSRAFKQANALLFCFLADKLELDEGYCRAVAEAPRRRRDDLLKSMIHQVAHASVGGPARLCPSATASTSSPMPTRWPSCRAPAASTLSSPPATASGVACRHLYRRQH